MKDLFLLLQKPADLPAGLHDYLTKNVGTKIVNKREQLLKIGDKCDKVFFIEKGLLRGFEKIKGQDNSIWFMKEGDLMFAVSSFYTQEPSQEGIEAIEDSILHYLNFDQLEWVYKTYPHFNFNGRKLTEKYYLRTWPDMQRLRLKTSIDRYRHFQKFNPGMEKRIPGIYLSSFLGISERTFYRTVNSVGKEKEKESKKGNGKK